MSYENWTMEKSRIWAGTDDTQAALDEYAAVAAWCNEMGNYTIIEDGEQYKVVEVVNDDEDITEDEEQSADDSAESEG